MLSAAKHLAKQMLGKIGLLDYAIYLYEGHVKGFRLSTYRDNLRYRLRGAPDGLPIPPLRLIWLSMGSIQIERFLESGKAHAHELIAPLLERNHLSMQRLAAVLDFGCGCGRVMRYWKTLPGVELWGVDYNPKMIEWCRRNLTFAQFQVNRLAPPLPQEPERFDFVYARSVFTHLTEAMQFAWLEEMRRILKPGGLFLFTVSGDGYQSWLQPEELAEYQRGQLVIRASGFEGRNECAVYHPPAYVRQQWPRHGFDIIDFVPGGQVRYAYQDTYLARKTSHSDMECNT